MRYAGAIRQIIFSQIASNEKYRLLLEGGLDIVRNAWDVRMKQRAQSFAATRLFLSAVRWKAIFSLTLLEADSIIRIPSQRLALLLTAAGRPLSDLQAGSLANLADHHFGVVFFSSLDPTTYPKTKPADAIAGRLTAAGLDISLVGLDWPALARRCREA